MEGIVLSSRRFENDHRNWKNQKTSVRENGRGRGKDRRHKRGGGGVETTLTSREAWRRKS